MTRQILKDKWILYRHISDFELLCEFAVQLKEFSKTIISKEQKSKMAQHLKEMGLYSERNPNLVLDATNHKINQLCFYMFGYKSNGRFIFSPLGNLFFKHKNDKERQKKIFTAMLWAVQFSHPHGGSDKKFQLYPFRLIFKLLCDERLESKLYAFEVAYLVMFVENAKSYENLVQEILTLRHKSNAELEILFKNQRHELVNASYEWDYYVSRLFESAGVLAKFDGEVMFKLQQGETKTFRKITRNYVCLNESVKEFVLKLEKAHSFLQTPLNLADEHRLKIDVIKEIYSFYPSVLLDEIGEIDSKTCKILELPKLIETYANNPQNKTSDLFEDVLVEGFNMFCNVEAKKLSKAGNTDIECLYITKQKKFAVEAKSTANKLLAINISRLNEHRKNIGGAYTIVITPRYVPAAKRDIVGSNVVIILANTFAEFLYNCISNDIREIDYGEFDEIVSANFGTDISAQISNLSLNKFGVFRC